MRTTNRLGLIDYLVIIGILFCLFTAGKVIMNWWDDTTMTRVDEWTADVTIVESFYTTNENGYNSYYLMWDAGHSTDIMKVCSACYAKYRDAERMPITITELESKHAHGYNFEMHGHYNYERTDK